MKKILFISLVLFSCTQSNKTVEEGYGGSVSLTANGKVVNLSKNAFEIVEGNLVLKSYSGDSLRIQVTLCDGIAKTTYLIVDTLANGILYFPQDGSTNYGPTYNAFVPNGNLLGRVEISDIDETKQIMSGTFSAKLARGSSPEMKIGDSTEMTITNGTFINVPYKLPEGPTGSVQIAKIDGQDFKGTLMSAYYGSRIDFTFSDKYRQINFILRDDVTVGEHAITEFEYDEIFPHIWYVDGLHSYKPRSGTLTIIEMTPFKHIKGTFSFEAESFPVAGKIKSITEGSFDVTFPNQ